MKKAFIILAFAFVLAAGLGASVALADKPPSPPGQGPCEHGNSGQPCRDDPSDNGKDCEEHGNKGGVNEDHCKGETEPPTTTTEPPTTTTEPPVTTTEPPVTTTDTTTTTETTTEEPPATTPDVPKCEPKVVTKVIYKTKTVTVVKTKPGKQPGTVIITTSDGKQHVGVQGSG